MDVRSFGAATTVTGSCHLLETGVSRLLVDCGAFQGSRALFALNRGPLGFDAREIDAVLLTHAHLDHCGRLPVLVRDGFDGPIWALPATRLLCEQLLMDAAKIQREDAARDRRKGRTPDEPLFVDEDVERTLALFEPLGYGRAVEVAGQRVVAQVAGHIPGSASFLVEAGGHRIAFSGDLGNQRKDVMPDPTPCPEADEVLIESTYGDRDHRRFDATIAELAGLIRDAADRGGKILVPSFALERTQDLLYHIARLEEDHEIPRLAVYVDSPLASRIEQVYDACHDELSEDVRLHYRRGRDPFRPSALRYTRSVEESKQINASPEPAIVIAGSGMLAGGRILHHLRAHIDDDRTTVLIVGYQPRGGLGRRLVEGADTVRIMRREVTVRARTVTIGGLSAHADRSELLRWASGAGAAARFRLVHGEHDALCALRGALEDRGLAARIQPSEVRLPDDEPRPAR